MNYVITSPGLATVRVMRGESPPIIDSGGPKYEVIDRPKQKGATRYVGSDPYRVSLSVMFDGWMSEEPVEIPIANLMRMYQESTSDSQSADTPDVFVNAGSPGGLPKHGIAWKMEAPDWGTNQIWKPNPNGVLVRYRQDAVIHLLEKVAVDTVVIGSENPGLTRVTGNKGATHSVHIVKPGETNLGQIAVFEYKGDRSKWRDIAKANGIRDPRNIHVDQKLILP